MSVKEQVLQAIYRLLEDADYRDIANEIALFAAVRGEAIIIGRVWPAAMGEADLQAPV